VILDGAATADGAAASDGTRPGRTKVVKSRKGGKARKAAEDHVAGAAGRFLLRGAAWRRRSRCA